MQKDNIKELLTAGEAAKLFRVDETTVRRWVKQGALTAVILPSASNRKVYRIKREVVEAVLSSPAVAVRG